MQCQPRASHPTSRRASPAECVSVTPSSAEACSCRNPLLTAIFPCLDQWRGSVRNADDDSPLGYADESQRRAGRYEHPRGIRPGGRCDCCSWTAAPAAHDVPNDVRIQVFLKPEGQVLRLLVRAPLASMNDIPWPTTGVFLNLADPGNADRAPRRRQGLDRRSHRRSTKKTIRLGRSSPRRGPRLAAIRHLVRFLRQRAPLAPRPAAAERHRARQEPGDGRRAARISDPLGADPASRSIRTIGCSVSRR